MRNRRGKTTRKYKTGKGVKQGCPLSPAIFSAILNEALSEYAAEGKPKGVTITKDGQLKPLKKTDDEYAEEEHELSHLLFADDIVLVAEGWEAMQQNLTRLDEILGKFGLQLSEKKTKVMEINNPKKWEVDQPELTLRGKTVQKVDEFVYLGHVISADARDTKDIARRLQLGNMALGRLRRTLWDKSLPKVLRTKLVTAFIYPIISYGSETWCTSVRDCDTLRIWWMKVLRMINRTKWYHKTLDEEVLKTLAHAKHLTTMVTSRRLRYAGHIYRYPTERFARKSLFACWPAKKVGRGGHNFPKWNAQVSKLLLEYDLDLSMPKKEYRAQLDVIYEQADLPVTQGKEKQAQPQPKEPETVAADEE